MCFSLLPSFSFPSRFNSLRLHFLLPRIFQLFLFPSLPVLSSLSLFSFLSIHLTILCLSLAYSFYSTSRFNLLWLLFLLSPCFLAIPLPALRFLSLPYLFIFFPVILLICASPSRSPFISFLDLIYFDFSSSSSPRIFQLFLFPLSASFTFLFIHFSFPSSYCLVPLPPFIPLFHF